MRILSVHNYYRQRGGEDVVVANERRMLVEAGHDVHLASVSNHEIATLGHHFRLLWQTAYAAEQERWMRGVIAEVRPDVVHVHNFFPLLTPAVHVAAAESGVAVVQTLHNYRLLCAGATFERDGKVCELCLEGSRFNALRHRCYRSSLPATASVVHMQNVNERYQLLNRNVHRFIALTEFARSKFIQGGLPPERIVVKPNFVDRPSTPEKGGSRTGALFVGRLSHEKGLRTLMAAWRNLPEIPLRIAGDGPLRGELERSAPSNVEFLGRIDGAAVERAMRMASVLIVPSLWYEGFPMTIVEAFANGLPVIASRLGSLAEIVSHGESGFLFETGNSQALEEAVNIATRDRSVLDNIGKNAQTIFEQRYSKDGNLLKLEQIYRSAMTTLDELQ